MVRTSIWTKSLSQISSPPLSLFLEFDPQPSTEASCSRGGGEKHPWDRVCRSFDSTQRVEVEEKKNTKRNMKPFWSRVSQPLSQDNRVHLCNVSLCHCWRKLFTGLTVFFFNSTWNQVPRHLFQEEGERHPWDRACRSFNCSQSWEKKKKTKRNMKAEYISLSTQDDRVHLCNVSLCHCCITPCRRKLFTGLMFLTWKPRNEIQKKTSFLDIFLSLLFLLSLSL